MLSGTSGIAVWGLLALGLVLPAAGVVYAQAPATSPPAVSAPPPAGAGDEAAARAAYEKGTAAYALGDFAEAARQYEAAFRLKLDPALLYNAAQAHRRANNRTRAIELYENLLRLFPNAPNRDVARQHRDELRKAAAAAPAAGVAPGAVTPAPAGISASTPAPGTLVPPPIPTFAPGSAAAPAVVETSSADAGRRPLYRRPWFWGAIAGVVLVGVATAVAVSAGDDPAASPSWGRVGSP